MTNEPHEKGERVRGAFPCPRVNLEESLCRELQQLTSSIELGRDAFACWCFLKQAYQRHDVRISPGSNERSTKHLQGPQARPKTAVIQEKDHAIQDPKASQCGRRINAIKKGVAKIVAGKLGDRADMLQWESNNRAVLFNESLVRQIVLRRQVRPLASEVPREPPARGNVPFHEDATIHADTLYYPTLTGCRNMPFTISCRLFQTNPWSMSTSPSLLCGSTLTKWSFQIILVGAPVL